MSKTNLVDDSGPAFRKPRREPLDISLSEVQEARSHVTGESSVKTQPEEKTVQPEVKDSSPKKETVKKQPVEKADKVVAAFRVSDEIAQEVARVASLHGHKASYAYRKILDQWMKASPEKREQILSK
jgi:hypothetical protein